MTSEQNTKIGKSMMALSIFYIAVGIVELGYFAMEAFTAPAHIPILGIVSLITAFLILKMMKWVIPFVIGLFLTGLTFAATSLSNSLALQAFGDAILFNMSLIVYMILLLIVTIYILAKKESFY
jgi:hypothetical protein